MARTGYEEPVSVNTQQCGVACPSGSKWENSANACVPIITPTPPAAPPPGVGDIGCGNPIYPTRGVKREVVRTDAVIAKHELRLTYDSTPKTPGSSADDLDPNAGPLGALWSSSLHRRLVLQGANGGVIVARGEGRVSSFLVATAGVYVPPSFSRDKLQRSGSDYVFTDAEEQSIEVYNSQGILIGVHWATGESASFTYSDATTPATVAPGLGYLISVTDQFGRSLSFAYGSSGRLERFEDAAQRSTILSYDAQLNLSSIAWPDGRSRQFHYEHPSLRWALTGVTDENGDRHSTFGYDTNGRAVSTERAGGVGRFATTYSTPPSIQTTDSYDPLKAAVIRSQSWVAPVGTEFRNPQGVADSLTTTTIGNRTFVTSRTQAAGAGCAASFSTQSFDANGNLASRNDFNGNRVCFKSDLSRNLEIVRVEGLAAAAACTVVEAGATLAAGSRKISTEWHPDWQLKTRIAEPGRITTFIYHGQSDPTAGGAIASCAPADALLPNGKPIAVLCKQVERATTDASGSSGFNATFESGVLPRSTLRTYNRLGQVLTETDAAGSTTTFTYFASTSFTGTGTAATGRTMGDLATASTAPTPNRPTGLVTSYIAYDRAGQLLQSQDPNGVTTTRTHDLRGRLLTSTTAGLTTNYEYWPTGLLKKLTLPDLS